MRKNTFKVWSAVLAFIIGFEAASPELMLRRQDANAVDIGSPVSFAGPAKSVVLNEISAAEEAKTPVKNDIAYEAESIVTADTADKKKLYGDVDGDGSVTEDDSYALEEKTLKNCPQGDVNADGVLDGEDADLIRNYVWYDDWYFPVGEYYDPDRKFVTRAEWAHAVAEELGIDLTDKSLLENVFSDLDGCEYADEITALANMGIIDRDDEDFRPDACADRRFAAEALNRIYGSVYYEIENDALDNGWFQPDKGEFHGSLYVTGDETAAHVEAAKNAPMIIRSDTKLSADLTIDKDLWIWAELDLNGHKLTAKKNVSISSEGTLYLHKGSAAVSGDLTLADGSLRMEDSSDKLVVNGIADMDSYSEHRLGTVEFKGDVKLRSMDFSGSNKVIFSGKKDQTLDIQYCSFNNVQITDSDTRSLIIKNTLEIPGVIAADGQKLSFVCDGNTEDTVKIELGTVKADELTVSGNCVLQTKNFGGSTITVDGDAELSDDSSLNGATLSVSGDLALNGRLVPGGGTVRVEGDLSNNRNEAIIMEDENDRLSVGGDTHFNGLSSIKAGTAEFSGLLYLDDTEFGGSNTAVFPGTGDLTIYTTGYSSLAAVEIPDAGKRTLILSGNLKASSVNCGDAPLNVKGSEYVFSPGIINCTEMTADGSCILGDISQGTCKKITLKGDAVITGTVNLDSTEITSAGKLSFSPEYFSYATKLISSSVSAKELVIENCQLTLDHSSIVASGNLTMNEDRIVISDEQAYISVKGDTVLTGDIIEGKGKLSCAGALSAPDGNTLKNITIELSGEKDQSLELSPDVKPEDIMVLNSDKRVIKPAGELYITKLSSDGGKVIFEGEETVIGALFLDTDAEFKGDVVLTYSGQFGYVGQKIGNADLNGHTLTVSGNFYHTNGTMYLNGGRLEISGDYTLAEGHGTSVLSKSSGSLFMENENDYVLVGGNFTTVSELNRLKDGTLEIKGDFYQYDDGSAYAFVAEGEHRVILSGTEKQTINFEGYPASHFNYLEMTQDKENYDFVNGQCWKFPGDINEDGSVDLKDVVLLRQHLTGWEVEICEKNADVNKDGIIDMKDLTLLRRFLAGGWDVTLK